MEALQRAAPAAAPRCSLGAPASRSRPHASPACRAAGSRFAGAPLPASGARCRARRGAACAPAAALKEGDTEQRSSSEHQPSGPGPAVPRPPPAQRRRAPPPPPPPDDGEDGAAGRPGIGAALEDVNPIALGRRSRAFVDGVWQRVLSLGSTRASGGAAGGLEEYERSRQYGGAVAGDFQTPQAAYHTVLVVGATGRVGTVLLRKLSLRGYTVRALVRTPAAAEGLPQSVQVVVGDVGDAAAVARAMDGVTKVVMCARARTAVTADVNNVDKAGMGNLIKAMLDKSSAGARAAVAARAAAAAPGGARVGPLPKFPVVKFSRNAGAADAWAEDASAPGPGMGAMMKQLGVRQPRAEVGRTAEGELRWTGIVVARGDAQVSGPLALPAGRSLGACDGLVLRARGDGKRYSLVLRTGADDAPASEQHWYAASFASRPTWAPVRLPFSAFRPLSPLAPPLLDASAARRIGLRFDARAQPRKAGAADPAADASGGRATAATDDSNAFELEVAFIKALPSGAEPDFVFVSCAGGGLSAEDAERVVPAKRAAEALLRNSGLGYTVLRPGPLLDEPGGAKALLFDQGGRITEGIAVADVADVCLKALHDAEARNTSFDVCHEYAPADGSRYELVAHLPDKNNNYLTPALAVLEKNT